MRHDSYFQQYAQWAEPDSQWAEPVRRRRATRSPQNRMCALFLQSDPLLWEYMTKPVTHGGKGYVSRTLYVCVVHSLFECFDWVWVCPVYTAGL